MVGIAIFAEGFLTAGALAIPLALMLAGRRHRLHSCQVEELGKLTGGLAHEIKNPLSTMKVNLKLISEDLDKNDPKLARPLRKIAVIQKESDRLEQILDGFLRYAGRVELQCAQADINELVGEMVDFFSPQAFSHAVTMRLGLSSERLVSKVDKTMLKQVLLNLFLNALQAMPGGGELIVRTARRKGEAVIEVSDTGSGIEPDKIERIFDAYYSSKASGSGLGLPTAKKIVEQHGGRICVTSEPGKGSSFTIMLPMHKE